MHNRNATRDLLLVFSASCVLTLALWPRGESRQVFEIETSQGNWESRSIALSDPIVQGIERQLAETQRLAHSPEVAVAAWKQELSSHYQKNPTITTDGEPASQTDVFATATTASISDEVVTASYESSESAKNLAAVTAITPGAPPGPAAMPSSPIPVRLREIAEPTRPQFAFHVAFLVGILMACIYKHWDTRYPKIAKQKKQPVAVRLRQYSLASLASLAGFAALLLVI